MQDGMWSHQVEVVESSSHVQCDGHYLLVGESGSVDDSLVPRPSRGGREGLGTRLG